MKEKINILFVGAFRRKLNGEITGGMNYACDSIVNSDISKNINWVLLDSTPKNNFARNILTRTLFAVKRLFKLLFLLSTQKIDQVLIFTANGGSFLEKGLMAIISKQFGKKVILSSRAGAIKEEMLRSKFMSNYVRRVFRSTDKILCQSQLWKEFFLKYASDKEKFLVVENWIHTDKYIAKNQEKFKKFTLLFMAWIIEEKGIFELLEAVKALEIKGFDFELLVCGGGDHFEDATLYAKEHLLSSVTFKGWTFGEDKLKLLHKSHAFILPSHYEGFSNSLLEAMASGLTVISTKVGSTPDIIKHKENGLLIELKNPNSICEAVEYCIKNPTERQNMGLKAKEKVLAENEISNAISKINQLFHQLSY